MSGRSPAGLNGYIEYLEIGGTGTSAIAKFASDQPIVDGKPAAVLSKLGRGQVIKLAFGPPMTLFSLSSATSVPQLTTCWRIPCPTACWQCRVPTTACS